jgi:hypothetical protein
MTKGVSERTLTGGGGFRTAFSEIARSVGGTEGEGGINKQLLSLCGQCVPFDHSAVLTSLFSPTAFRSRFHVQITVIVH